MNNSSSSSSTLAALVLLSAGKHLLLAALARLARHRPVLVGHVTRLVVYPVKSTRGVDVERAECDRTGLVGLVATRRSRDDDVESSSTGLMLRDRIWMVATSTYCAVTARQLPKMTTIVPSIHDNSLQLDAPGMESIRVTIDNSRSLPTVTAQVWGESVEAVDCGDEIAFWLNKFLGRHDDNKAGYRLVYHQSGLTERHCDQGQTRWHKTAKPQDAVVFSDGFPFMLMNESSVAELNERLVTSSALPVTMDHFRPNIVVGGSTAFDEEDWHELYIGDATFRNIKPCQRCVLTTINPELGQKRKDNEPLATLRQYRLLEPEFGQSPCFGINLVLNKPGVIQVGDVIRATRQ